MTLPVSESDQPVQAGPAIPAIEDDAAPVAGAALPVVIVSDVAARGQLSGDPIHVSFVTDRIVAAGNALPIVLVGGATGLLVDSFGTQPQRGTRTITGSSWTLEDKALRGGRQLSSPAWGASRVVYTDADNQPFVWQAGRIVAALLTPADFADVWFFGLSSSATPGDPNADTGYHWILDAGQLKVRAKDQTITYEQGQSNIRTSTYLAYWLLLDNGAALFLQSVTDDSGGGMTDPIGLFGAPDARLVGVWERGTLATFYPVVSALGTGNPDYPGGHMVQQMRVVDVPDLVLPAFVDRFDRADTASVIGNGWNAIGCVAGITSGQAHISSGSGFQFVMHANTLANCRIVVDLSFPQYPTIPLVGVIVHGDSVSNFQNGIRIHTNGGNNLFVQAVQNRGFLDTLYSGPVTWQATNHVEIILYNNQYKVFVNGIDAMSGMWRVDSNSYYVNQTHIGLYSQADPNTARWDNMQVYPHAVIVPELVTTFSGPTVFEPGTTLLSGVAGLVTVSGTWTNNSGVLSQTIASGEAWRRQAVAAGGIEVEIDLLLPSGNPVSLAGIGVGSFSGATITSGLVARLYRDPPSQPTNHEIELLQFANGSGVIIRKTTLGVFYAASTTYNLKFQIGEDRHRADSMIVYVLINDRVWLSYPVPASVTWTDIVLYANSLDTDTRFANLVVRRLA